MSDNVRRDTTMNGASESDGGIQLDLYRLEVGLDYGTHNWVSAYSLSYAGTHTIMPRLVVFDSGKSDVRMMAAWVNGRLVQGYHLDQYVNTDKLISDKIIDYFKLGLYEGNEVAGIKARNEGILASVGKTLDDLLAEHLYAVVEHIKSGIRKSKAMMTKFSPTQMDELFDQMKVRISVPAVWSPNARQRMQAAAKASGLELVVLAGEPQCAMATLVRNAAKDIVDDVPDLVKGSVSLVADLGSGTADFVLSRLQDDLSATSRFDAIDVSSGGICGAYRVDHLLYEKVMARKGRDWLINAADRLQVTERDFKRRALDAIDQLKREFKKYDQDKICTVYGTSNAWQTIEITREEIMNALDEVTATIISRMDSLVAQETPDLIELTGGFSKNWYVFEKISSRYKSDRTSVIRSDNTPNAPCSAVAFGTLYRYDSIDEQNLPSKYGYALLRREVFDKDAHGDSFTIGKKNSHRTYSRPWVLSDPYDNKVNVVDDRIHNIINKGTKITPDSEHKLGSVLIYHVPVDDPRISAEFVYLDKLFKDSAASRDHTVEQRNKRRYGGEIVRVFLDSVHPWVEVDLPMPKDKLQSKGFPVVDVGSEEKFYKLNVRVVIRAVAKDMQVCFDVLKPNANLETVDSSFCGMGENDGDGDTAFRVRDTVWEGCHSEFAQD